MLKTYLPKSGFLIPRLILCFWIFIFLQPVSASVGDRSYVFITCVNDCENSNCSSPSEFHSKQPLFLWLLQWSCADECRYECMWTTVDDLQKKKSRIPQFFGKWPFGRLFGIQEPASVFFSILNGLGHLRIITYRKLVPSRVPMYYIWHIYAFLGLNSWFWSAVFHARDTKLTEKLDYFSAFGFVLSNSYAALCRLFGSCAWFNPIVLATVMIGWFTFHVWYLTFIFFDYGFNMQMNVLAGALNFLTWMTFAYKEGVEKQHVKKCMIAIGGLTFLVLLELLDFSPFFWIFDAHSIWHAGTSPLTYIGYSFIIEDGLILASKTEQKQRRGMNKVV